jgi:hypothetical protein
MNGTDGAAPQDGGAQEAGAPDASCQVTLPIGDAGVLIACTADGGVDAGDNSCGFSACLSGGLTEGFGPQTACGTIGQDTLFWDDENPTTLQTSFTLHLSANVPLDQIGPLPVTAVEIKKGLGDDAGTAKWITPSGACSATVTDSVCSPTFTFPHRRVLKGTGGCSQPAAPEPGTSGAPVDIGGFVFSGFINPP